MERFRGTRFIDKPRIRRRQYGRARVDFNRRWHFRVSSPKYDPNALRAARLGPDVVEQLERLRSDVDACLDAHTAAECAAQAGG